MTNTMNPFAVRVVGTTGGNVIQPNMTKPEYGSIMLEQPHYTVRNGFLNARRKVAFIAGTMDELTNFVSRMTIREGSELPGKLFVKEQFTPYYEGQYAKLNPSTGRAILVDGALVYSKTFWDESGTQPDVYLTGEITEGDVITRSEIPETLKMLL